MAMTVASTMAPKRLLGEMLLDGEFISESQLSHALDEQRATNERLGETLVRLGVLSDMELRAALSMHADLDTPDDIMAAGAGARHRLGDILLKAKRVKPQQLDRALDEQRRTNEKLGEVLVRFGLISGAELDAILAWQADGGKSAQAVKLMLGEILVATHVISRFQLEDALKEQRLHKKQIGEILVTAGLVKPNQIAEALKIQSKLFAATIVAVVAAGTLTGCGMTAPTVGGDAYGLGNSQHGVAVTYNASSPSQHLQGGAGGSGGKTVTSYQNGAHVVDNVPFVHQNVTDNTCAQAASTVLLNYWGVDIEYQQVVNESNRFNLGTTPTTAEKYLKSKGLNVQPYRNGNLGFLKSLVDNGRPPMVMLDFDGAEHWVVVVGYRDGAGAGGGKIILHDSIDGAYSELDQKTFEKYWANTTLKNIPGIGNANMHNLIFDVSK